MKDSILQIGGLANTYSMRSSAVPSSSPLGVDIVRALKRLQRDVESVLAKSNVNKLCVSISKGRSNLPRILYVAVSRTIDRLSSEPCVGICFDERGSGVVIGMMYPQVYLKTTKHEKKVRSKGEMLVDLSSSRSKSNFNDLFVNPYELTLEDLDCELLTNHLLESIRLLEAEIYEH